MSDNILRNFLLKQENALPPKAIERKKTERKDRHYYERSRTNQDPKFQARFRSGQRETLSSEATEGQQEEHVPVLPEPKKDDHTRISYSMNTMFSIARKGRFRTMAAYPNDCPLFSKAWEEAVSVIDEEEDKVKKLSWFDELVNEERKQNSEANEINNAMVDTIFFGIQPNEEESFEVDDGFPKAKDFFPNLIDFGISDEFNNLLLISANVYSENEKKLRELHHFLTQLHQQCESKAQQLQQSVSFLIPEMGVGFELSSERLQQLQQMQQMQQLQQLQLQQLHQQMISNEVKMQQINTDYGMLQQMFCEYLANLGSNETSVGVGGVGGEFQVPKEIFNRLSTKYEMVK